MKLGLWVFRVVFVLGCLGVGLAVNSILAEAGVYDHQREISSKWAPFIAVSCVAAGVLTVVLDLLFSRRPVQSFTAVFFGLLAGLITASLFRFVLDATPLPRHYVNAAYLMMLVIFCYLGVTIIMQTKDNFRFIVPYVEFSRETRGRRPIILDTSVIIDGRIADVCETGFLDAPIVIPRFVLQELQVIADAEDKVRRKRGRRGLDMLNRLRRNRDLDLMIHDTLLAEGEMVDSKLINLAKALDGRIMTNDFNLNKVAELQNVEVVNINELANALKSVLVAGERLTVDIIKAGEEPGQGVGYLDDGTMVVVDGGGSSIGHQVSIMVTSVLQTSAGRMVFGRPVEAQSVAGTAGPPAGARRG
jgi:uncharacterized protein YacL